MHDMKAIRDAAERTLAPLHVHDERAVAQRKFDSYTLAAFVRDITDETPADREWVEQVTPKIDGAYGEHDAFTMTAGGGLRVLPSMNDEDIYWAGPWPRGRVRMLALAMGLTLREGGR